MFNSQFAEADSYKSRSVTPGACVSEAGQQGSEEEWQESLYILQRLVSGVGYACHKIMVTIFCVWVALGYGATYPLGVNLEEKILVKRNLGIGFLLSGYASNLDMLYNTSVEGSC